mmetsp:Transcript_27260/g.40247  ORF Transcript_27260/g.40247 Transcript_27260/m.40247 type:complete len:189 (-) Transcript_27260:499-1065(-)|eukprot:CAMPEP_0194215660 /NCGR_PEP_ID=MMETSP0156-20130528/17628_1 /TAXON_ID=33649 /ORGANISM="Thalassionema nitzschioides, Strain L26-B" /LENGTH=188 /DNA_ID=CAMNT_0038944233 /DNA_START=94 /DNA_END=660 /DNA_ORIENTATION=-
MSQQHSNEMEDFSSVDDQNIWKAFLTASRDRELGFRKVPKSQRFQRKMDNAYLKKLDEENKQRKYCGLREKHFSSRPLESIIARYNDYIGREAFRFLVVMKTIPMTRKKTHESFYKECGYRFEEKYGRSFDFKVKKQDRKLILTWLENIDLDDPDIVLQEFSDTASDFSNGITEIGNYIGHSLRLMVK